MEGSPKRQKPEEELILYRVPTFIPRHVTNLVLRDCGIAFIPDVLLECTWLKRLDLSHNQFFDPLDVGNWTSLEVIDISWSQLTKLPDTVGNWISLKEINLSYNDLRELPEAVGNWTSLKKIRLESNQLTELSEAVGNWTFLYYIDIYETKLKKLPDTVQNWTSLEVIDLSHTQITVLPEAVGNWRSLEAIYLYENELKDLPDAVGNWASLSIIYLPEDMKCPKRAKGFKKYFASRMLRKKEATLLYWALKKTGLPRDLANLGRKEMYKSTALF